MTPDHVVAAVIDFLATLAFVGVAFVVSGVIAAGAIAFCRRFNIT